MDPSDTFEILSPDGRTSSVVLSSPHSGQQYPAHFLSQTRLSLEKLRRGEDTFVDELFLPVVNQGAPMLRALFPRSFLDVNREPYELDPRMFDGRLPGFANTRSVKVAGGLGSVPRIIGENIDIYAGRLPVDEALQRIAFYHKPYHLALKHLLALAKRQSGHSILIDCHSMPSLSVAREPAPKADIVLGDRYGTSCSPLLMEILETSARRLGYTVIRNKPYAGGFITEYYGQPQVESHAVQIEINRAIYMNESTLERKPGFKNLQQDLLQILEPVFELDKTELGSFRTAAE